MNRGVYLAMESDNNDRGICRDRGTNEWSQEWQCLFEAETTSGTIEIGTYLDKFYSRVQIGRVNSRTLGRS